MKRGIALLSALSVLALLGLLIVGGVTATVVVQRTETLTSAAIDLDAACDFALGSVLSDPAAYGIRDTELGVPRTMDVAISNAAVHVVVSVTRLPLDTYWIVVDAESPNGGRRVGVIARSHAPGSVPADAVIARGAASLSGDVVLALDTASSPECRATAGADVRHSADSSAFFLTAAQMTSLDASNSVRHVRGDTTILGGTFSGILFVDGAVTFAGPTSITGLVIARGSVRGSGLTLLGALLSFSGGESAVELSSSTIRYSPCEIARVFRAGFPIRIVRRRGWAQLF